MMTGLEMRGREGGLEYLPSSHPANLISEQAGYSKVMPGWPLLVGGCCCDKIPTASTKCPLDTGQWQCRARWMTGVKSKEVSGRIIIVIISTS